MGFWSKFFVARAPGPQEVLISGILEAETQRRKIEQEILLKDREIRLKEKELEMEHLEALHEQKRKDQQHAGELRELRRKWAAGAREALAKKRALEASAAPQGGFNRCKVCLSPGDASTTAQEILWHHQGHPGMVTVQ